MGCSLYSPSILDNEGPKKRTIPRQCRREKAVALAYNQTMTDELNSPALELRGVAFSFSKSIPPILNDLSLVIEPAQTFVLFGLTGSGKTTLLKIVAGILGPTQGQVFCEGREVKRSSRAKGRDWARSIGMSFQKGGLLDAFNVEGNIDFALQELTSKSLAERKEITGWALEQVGLFESRNKTIRELSGGMQKRLSLARAIALRPKVLLLDEPTAGLDPVTSSDILEMIQVYQKESQSTLLVATSDLSVGFLLATQLGFLWNGRVIEVSDPARFRSSEHPAVKQFIKGEPKGPLETF